MCTDYASITLCSLPIIWAQNHTFHVVFCRYHCRAHHRSIMISFKSKISSPSRFGLSSKKPPQNTSKLPSPRSPNPQDCSLSYVSFLMLVELRHTEIWTRDHLDWFNVDFDPSCFHTVPIAFAPMSSPAQGRPTGESHTDFQVSKR